MARGLTQHESDPAPGRCELARASAPTRVRTPARAGTRARALPERKDMLARVRALAACARAGWSDGCRDVVGLNTRLAESQVL